MMTVAFGSSHSVSAPSFRLLVPRRTWLLHSSPLDPPTRVSDGLIRQSSSAYELGYHSSFMGPYDFHHQYLRVTGTVFLIV